MYSRLKKAIRNNNGLYESVFGCLNISFDNTNENSWHCDERVPPFYSNIVTKSGKWRQDTVFDEIDRKAKALDWDSWSIKDSFDVLDLTSAGFEKLFEAHWIYLNCAEFKSDTGTHGLRYEIVKSAEMIKRWRAGWDSDIELGERIFSDELLDDDSVWFIAGSGNGEIVTGCLINRTDDVLGISNFFCPGIGDGYWTEMVVAIFDLIGSYDLVGYERETSLLNETKDAGFEAIGKLSVWEKSCRPN